MHISNNESLENDKQYPPVSGMVVAYIALALCFIEPADDEGTADQRVLAALAKAFEGNPCIPESAH